AITFAGTTAGNSYTINVGGPIATAVTAVVTDTAAQLQARLNAPGVLAAGITGVRVFQLGGSPNFTNVIVFNTTTNVLPMSVTNPTTGTTTVTTLVNGGLLGRQTVAGLTMQAGYDTTNPATGTVSGVALDAG